jgi:hypothetical protein
MFVDEWQRWDRLEVARLWSQSRMWGFRRGSERVGSEDGMLRGVVGCLGQFNVCSNWQTAER